MNSGQDIKGAMFQNEQMVSDLLNLTRCCHTANYFGMLHKAKLTD